VNVIGICGRKRHGKDTVGGFLQQEEKFTPIAFADPIKKIAMELYGFTYEQCYGDEKEVPDPRWEGLTPRHAMQQIGTEVARGIHSETWIRYCFETMSKAARGENPEIHWAPAKGFIPAKEAYLGKGTFDLQAPDMSRWCITDVRFPNEAAFIKAQGGKVVKVVRPALEGKQGDTHASETSIDEIEPDVLLVNDGTLEDLLLSVQGSLELLLR